MTDFEKMTDLNALRRAAEKCMRGVGWKCSAQRYGAMELMNISRLRRSLLDGTYRQRPFSEFDISERGKTRHIKALHICDRVLQRALCDEVLIPAVRRKAVHDNGASLEGKGVAFARRRLKVHLERHYRRHGNKGWVLRTDFTKFFDSIPHGQLMEKFRELTDDGRVLSLIEGMLEANGERGVGIGSQLSQAAGIYYPHRMDTWCKTVRGMKCYGRYMDDAYVIHESREELERLLLEIDAICGGLGLALNRRKTGIFRLEDGFTFLNMRYRLKGSGRILVSPMRKTYTREMRKLRKTARILPAEDVAAQYRSWRGTYRKYGRHGMIRKLDALCRDLTADARKHRMAAGGQNG